MFTMNTYVPWYVFVFICMCTHVYPCVYVGFYGVYVVPVYMYVSECIDMYMYVQYVCVHVHVCIVCMNQFYGTTFHFQPVCELTFVQLVTEVCVCGNLI